ncbi:hypothetical protein SRABI80_04563 [Peribacillus frigoritolerans]|nr:hypothetical protein SRABI80_04563 [Peribacillus frigoritolerans]
MGVYLSIIDLEHDLHDVLEERLNDILGTSEPVRYLQNKKLYNMVELVEKMSVEDSKKIYSNPLFSCLKKMCGEN